MACRSEPPPFAAAKPRPAELPAGVEILDEAQGQFCFGAIQNIMVVVWIGEAAPSTLQRLARAVTRMDQAWPKGRSAVHVVLPSVQVPDDAAQQAFLRLVQRSKAACIAVVFLGAGFHISRLRSKNTALTLEARVDFPFRQLGSLREVAEWLPAESSRRTGVVVTPGFFEQAIQLLVPQP